MNAKDRLIFPLDVPDADQARKYVRLLGNHVGVFKVGLELFVSEGPSIVDAIADMTDAGIFLDLKFHDIPATVQRAIRSASCLKKASFITVHCDPVLLEAVVTEVAGHINILAVTVLTSLDSNDLMSLGIREELAAEPIQLVLQRAAIAKQAGCTGIVCSGREATAVKKKFGGDLIVVTPGIRPDWGDVEKDDQARVVTPYLAVKNGADYIVVGRPIRTAPDPVGAAVKVVEEIEKGLQDRQQTA
ncbi:MAG: orotidine-5'-phosphate decarboxylase [Deltaproteobacteria bacterium]|jgi:orotidine-5'-phosphate decarboxylase|nr:orotidine-5'-phosphate decarboxylase [Deltaproteobacteria bacterium]